MSAFTSGRNGSVLESIQAAVVDDLQRREALFEAFVYSQKFSQSDPWSERARGVKDAHEFAPMADLTRMEAAE